MTYLIIFIILWILSGIGAWWILKCANSEQEINIHPEDIGMLLLFILLGFTSIVIMLVTYPANKPIFIIKKCKAKSQKLLDNKLKIE